LPSLAVRPGYERQPHLKALIALLFRCVWKAVVMDSTQLTELTCTIFEALVVQVNTMQHRAIYAFLISECQRETRRQHSTQPLSSAAPASAGAAAAVDAAAAAAAVEMDGFGAAAAAAGLQREELARGWAALKLLEVVQGSAAARAAGETRLRFMQIVEVLLQLKGPLYALSPPSPCRRPRLVAALLFVSCGYRMRW
jgi:hypothetical protein